MDVILGMIWLEFNHVHINYLDTSMPFPEFDASDELFVFAKEVDEFTKDDVKVFMILAYMKFKIKDMVGDLPMVYNFLEVFLDDSNELPPKHEVEFSIDLVPRTSLV